MEMGLAHRPMKKAIIILAVLGVFILAGVLFFKRSGGPSKASLLAPADTVFYVNIPNVPMSGFRWQKTALARIAAEPEVAAFLKKPTTLVRESPVGKEVLKLLAALKPGNIFFAMTEESSPGFNALLGFQFWGKRSDFDIAVERLRQSLPGGSGELKTEIYRGIDLSGSRHGDRVLWSAAAGRWGLLASNLDVLRSAIDRATGAESVTRLGESEQFRKVAAALPSEPDLLVFVRPDKVANALIHAGHAAGAELILAQAAALKGAEAVGAAWKMEGELQRDAVFVMRPRNLEALPKLSHQAMELTTADSDFFFDFVLNFDALPGFLEFMEDTFPDEVFRLEPYSQVFSQAFGPECAVVGNWATGKMAPSAFVAVQVRNKEKAASFSRFLAENVDGAVSNIVQETSVTTIPSGQGEFTFVQNDKFLLVGTNAAQLVELATGEGGNATKAATPGFESAIKAYRGANEMFGFIDTRVVFENLYTSLVPVLRLSAMMVPKVSEVINVEKMPAAEKIGKILPPIVVSQKVSAEGTLLESSGPVSLTQFLMIGGAAADVAKQNLFKR